jgi:hypothetical protein
MTPTDADVNAGEGWLGRHGCTAADLYAGIPVTTTQQRWPGTKSCSAPLPRMSRATQRPFGNLPSIDHWLLNVDPSTPVTPCTPSSSTTSMYSSRGSPIEASSHPSERSTPTACVTLRITTPRGTRSRSAALHSDQNRRHDRGWTDAVPTSGIRLVILRIWRSAEPTRHHPASDQSSGHIALATHRRVARTGRHRLDNAVTGSQTARWPPQDKHF